MNEESMSMNRTDWKDMQAGPKLDQLIAERLGWKLVMQSDKYIRCIVLDPSGNMPAPALPADMPDQAWALALSSKNGVPAYSTSVDAAMTLIPESELGAEMIKGTDSWAVKLVFKDGVFKGVANNRSALALAICRAWLAWREWIG